VTPSGSPTGTPTDTPTGTPTDTPTDTPTGTPTDTPTALPDGHGFVDTSTHVLGSGADLVHKVERDYGLFNGVIKVDGATLDPSQYETYAGSTMTILKAAYLDTLAVGRHELTVGFRTGDVTDEFWIEGAAPTASPTAGPSASPSASASAKPLPGTGAEVGGPTAALSILVLAVGLILTGTGVLWHHRRQTK
jgi:hypothetical protein